MFVHMKKLPAKTADVFDLALEFATLGEYGLEYPGQSPIPPSSPCDNGRRSLQFTSTPGARAVECRKRNQGAVCSTESSDFASALRPPRIKLSFTQ